MSETLTCGTHGKQPATYVCTHIIDSLKTGEPVGFWWSVEDGDYTAICGECNEMSEAEWEQEAPKLIQILCKGCFMDAANMNDIDIEGAA